MRAQALKQQFQIQEWAEQIKEREASGLSVKDWCSEKGLNSKTYYNRVRRVREFMLEALESEGPGQTPRGLVPASTRPATQSAPPIFAPMPLQQTKGSAITVWIGSCAVDIQNGADDALIEQTLRVVSRL